MKIRNEKKRRSWEYGWTSYFMDWTHERTVRLATKSPYLDEAAAQRGWEMAATIDFENDGNQGSFNRFCPYI